ncbi:glycosyltransferase family 41 protein [Azoarcus sp. KH32C]|uniref:tetratricopeptide repeat protein n=1 Tax=Azoarcus sp. KH32C TaxID=748247 RepID=UPI0002386C53|nr:glycosyltransferase family 41 protein [Azoarcus sp. KH32C]BAL23855.1 hypothetical protein AZKH_1534 [Azoarcus sp. KH32C]
MAIKRNVDQKFDQAVALHRDGRLGEAIMAYRAVLAKDAKHQFARHYLGVAYHQSGQLAEALPLLESSTAKLADTAGCRLNLANLYKDLGRFRDAEKHYLAARALNPDLPLIGFNLGQMRERQGDLAGAVEAYRTAGALPEVLRRLAVLRIDEAPEEALALLSTPPDQTALVERELLREAVPLLAYANLAERAQSAIARLAALGAADELVEAGATLARSGQLQLARIALGEAIRHQPENIRAVAALGTVLNDLAEFGAAAEVLAQGLAHAPDDYRLHVAHGDALKELGDLDGAIAALETAIRLQPQRLDYHSNLQQLRLCQPGWQPADALALAQEYAAAVSHHAPRPDGLPPLAAPTPRTGRRVRIGLLSAELAWTPIGRFLAGFLRHFPRDRIELWVFSDRHDTPDALESEFRKRVHRWVECSGWPDEQLARSILDARLDVLLDLTGHAGPNRLPMLSWHLAPKQGTFLGYAGTTGAPGVDFRIADGITEPQGAEATSSERIVRLPGSYFCFDPACELPPEGPLPARRNGFVTFGCFVQRPKISVETLRSWIAVLDAVPNARMQVRCRSFTDTAARSRMAEQIAALGGDAVRFDLLPWGSRDDFLRNYQQIDIGLNTFPFHQATNLCDALWMGVPTLGLSGTGHQSRMAVSICDAAGVGPWSYPNVGTLAAAAAAMAGNLDELETLRATLRKRISASPLADQRGFAARLSEALLSV